MSNNRYKHGRDQNCDCCKHGMEAVLKADHDAIAKQGWTAHVVRDDENTGLLNYHTHGFVDMFGCDDIQFYINADPVDLHTLAWRIVESIEAGTKPTNGMVLKVIYEIASPTGKSDVGVKLIETDESGRRVLRVILPDHGGCLDRNARDGFADQWHGMAPELE